MSGWSIGQGGQQDPCGALQMEGLSIGRGWMLNLLDIWAAEDGRGSGQQGDSCLVFEGLDDRGVA